MNPKALLKDPVFHLNLLLWMSMEQPGADYYVRPLFYQWGFKLLYIEKPFSFPPALATAIQESELKIHSNPEPEVILTRDSDKKALYFEAKTQSFSSTSSTASQACGHLLATGAFSDVYAPHKSCLLCYVLPADQDKGLAVCLEELTDKIRKEGMEPGPYSVHKLALKHADIVYTWDEGLQSYLGIQESQAAILSNVSEDTDPTPLVLLFSDEDHHTPDMQDYYRKVVINQIHATLLCELRNHPLSETYFTTPEDVLMKTSQGCFSYLSRVRQTSLRRLVWKNVFTPIEKHWSEKQQGIRLNDKEEKLFIQWNLSGEKEDFLGWLERFKFEASKPKRDIPAPPDMFASMDVSAQKD